MNPYVFTYNSIGITWFMFFTVVSTIVGYGLIKFLAKKSHIENNIIEDTYFLLLVVGLIGSRLAYVMLNLDIYKDDFTYVWRLSHLNLNLAGGIGIGLVGLWIVSKMKKVDFSEMTNIYTIPLYLSLAAGVWTMYFDGLLLGKKYSGFLSMNYLGADRHIVTLYLSALFIVAMIWEGMKFLKVDTRERFKYSSVITLFVVMIIYYLIKSIFAY